MGNITAGTGDEAAPGISTDDVEPTRSAIDETNSHGELVRRVIVFQAKLFLDGLRDLLLSPLSIIAAVLGLLSQRSDPHFYFERLLMFGRGSERWINLFERYDADRMRRPGSTVDDWVDAAEDVVRRERRERRTRSPRDFK